MKTVVITGSARGFGYAMLEEFRKRGYNTVIVDVNEEALKKAEENLNKVKGRGKVFAYVCDITQGKEIDNLLTNVLQKVKTIDIWVNNAGVNQPMVPVWELEDKTVEKMLNIDLKGAILCSKRIVSVMKDQKFGQIYNVEGHGSNDATILGLSIYGTAKRAITYFTEALAFEVEKEGLNIQVGKITPGIMITNFIGTSLGDGKKIELSESTKKIYNILGDYPETIAKFMVEKMVNNKKNKTKFVWLSNGRATLKFLTYGFKKTNYFE